MNQDRISKFKKYIGDSVYADFDGYHVILTTENNLPSDPSNRIALEPGVFRQLEEYVKWLMTQFAEEKAE